MRQKGFTLIELLVVIAIIALLLSVILPSLRLVKKRAQGMMCKSNLRQWGIIWRLYSNDNDAKFPYWKVEGGGYHRGAWIQALRRYFPEREKMLLCPTATKKRPEYLQAGGTYPTNTPGGINYAYCMGAPTGAVSGITEPEWCSYGMNTWCTSNGGDAGSSQGRPANLLWGSFENVRSPSEVPLVLDSMWRGAAPNSDNNPGVRLAPPAEEGKWYGFNYEMTHFCIPRHGKGRINVTFVDLSIKDIHMKELWTQSWYQDYDKSYQPTWPSWMQKYD